MGNLNRRQFIQYASVAAGAGILSVASNNRFAAASVSSNDLDAQISQIVLRKVMLVGNWPSDTQVDIRFLDQKIGAPLAVNQTSKWFQYPPDTTLALAADGNLWQYWNGDFFRMCTQPLDIDSNQKNAEAVITTSFGDAHIKYDIVL